MPRLHLRYSLFGLLLPCITVGLFAQAPTGDITGTITDPTGAAISGAKITVTNTGTAAQRQVTSNAAGVYDFPALPPGNYSMRVEQAGFKTEQRTNVELQVGQVARIDVALQVGNLTETVEVQGGAPVLETEDATVGTVIENKRIVDLPLNGRNPLQLVSLTPGATTNGPASSQGQQRMGGARNQFAMNVSGQRLEYNHFMLDGVENTDPNFNTYLFLPSVDALQEFKVESGTYSAEFGRGLTQINMTTLSGTNQLHGALFEFLRNSDLDAKNFFDPPGPIAPFRRNQFGATAGGPIWIPKILNGKDKLFWFFDYEGLRQAKAQTAILSMPPALDRTGNFSGFSGTIYDPTTRVLNADGTVTAGTPFPGNTIPSTRISPISTQVLQNWFPLPNRGVSGYTSDYVDNEGTKLNNDQYTIRGDYVQSTSSTFTFRFSHTDDSGYTPLTTPGLGYNNQVTVDQPMIGNTWVIGPTKVNEFKFAISRLNGANQQPSANKTNWVSKLGIGGVPTDISEYWGVPVFQWSNNAISGVGECSDCPFVNHDTVFEWTDNFSWTHGKHSFKFGTDTRRMRYNQIGAVVARGRFTYSGTYTASPTISSPPPQNDLADFLLGSQYTSEGQSGAPIAAFRDYSMNFYALDSWKVTSKLTVNYGLRYELEPPYSDKYDHIVNISFNWANTIYPAVYVRAGNGNFYGGNPPPTFQLPAGIPFVRDGSFGDRAYQTSYRDFAPRLGLAYSIDPKTVIRVGTGIYYVRDIGNAQFDLVRNAPFSTRRSENAQSTLIPTLNFQVPFQQTATPSFILVNQYNMHTPYVPEWSFSVERQLSGNSSFEASYVGSSGVHLQRLMTYNTAAPGPPTNINNRRPQWPYYGGTFQTMADPSHSTYHSLQLRFQQRLSHGLTVLSAYSFSKSIDNGSGVRTSDGDPLTPSNDYNLRLDRGLSAFDFRNRWTTSFLYSLPIGRGRALLGNANRMADSMLGGWQVGGIATLQSGFPFTLSCGSSSVQNGGDGCYPDNLGGNPNLPDNVRGPARWFNIANFVNRINDPSLPQYRFGNNNRNGVIGPPLVDVDFSVSKTFRFTEKRGLEFRSEFFNLPNHAIFGQPNTSTGTPAFGTITSTRIDSREIQFALKLNY